MVQHKLIVLACLLASARLAAAGCAGEIFDCKGPKDPCVNKQCGEGMVCRTDNCKGCFAKCEPPGMVHIMSMPSAEPAMQPTPLPSTVAPGGTGSSSAGSGSSSQPQPTTDKVTPTPGAGSGSGSSSQPQPTPKVTQEAGCRCPRIYSPVCGSDGKVYNNKCLAECAKVTVMPQAPNNGKCPQGAYGTPKAQSQPQPASKPQTFTCRCAKMYKPVCGSDGVFYDNECLAICEGVKVSQVKPDVSAKKCNMKSSN